MNPILKKDTLITILPKEAKDGFDFFADYANEAVF